MLFIRLVLVLKGCLSINIIWFGMVKEVNNGGFFMVSDGW